MRTRLCDQLGVEYPIFAFAHCRDVVAAVSRAGGFGVLGAAGFTPEQLEIELAWIDANVGGKPYGVDFIMPFGDAAAMGGTPEEVVARLRAMIPDEHRAFVAELIARFDIPPLPEGEPEFTGVIGWTPEVAYRQVDVALSHPVRLVANALGPPPREVVERAHAQGVLVAALAGRTEHAVRHVANGVDIVVAQGYEAGGHTGDIATMVLVPEVVDAVRPAPVLAAGGIASGRQIAAALALGADGVWTGSVWLTTSEGGVDPGLVQRYLDAASGDTVRSRSFSGKPARQLRSPWTDAWEAPDSPGALPMPLQTVLVAGAYQRIEQARREDVMFAPVGQVVGRLTRVQRVKDVVREMVEEYVDTIERLYGGLGGGRGA